MRLNQVTIPARNLAESIVFYQVLGMKLIVRNDHYARFEVGDGTDTLSLHDSGDTLDGASGAQIYFECDDLDARVAALEAKGIKFESAPQDKSWLWREAWLSDPSGVRLCLYYAGENRRFPPWRIRE